MRAPPESFSPTIGAPSFIAEIHDLHDLRGVGLRERSAEHGEVLREGEDLAAVDEAVAGDDAVARDDLLSIPKSRQRWVTSLSSSSKVPGIEQQLDPLARGQLAGGVLALCSRVLAAAELGAALEVGERCRAWDLHLRLTACDFLPVLQELLEADVGERVVEQLIDHRRRTRAMSAPMRAASIDVNRMAAAGDQHFGRELVVVVDLDDLANQIHAVGRRRRRAGRRTG